MEPTSLSRLLAEGGVTLTDRGLIVQVRPDWIVDGEDRLSHTTLFRLTECCREHHWNKDILARAPGIDAIGRTVSGEFLRPISSDSVIAITYRVKEVRSKGYSLRFEIRDSSTDVLHCTFDMGCVFYDAKEEKSVPPPTDVVEYLAGQARQSHEGDVGEVPGDRS